jgi:GT2 family glycosyltransferase
VGGPRVSIVLLVWIRVDHLVACLQSIRARVGSSCSYEVVLVLNGAAPGAVDAIAASMTGVRTVVSDVNLGFGGGCNLGAAHSRGDYLVFLNDDTVVEDGWLEHLVATADANPRAGAVASRILFPDGRLQEAGSVIWRDGSTAGVGRGVAGDSPDWFFVRRIDYGSACSLLVKRSTWNDLGGFDDAFSPAYYEDVDLCLRIAASGQDVLYEPRSCVRHHESSSSSSEFKFFLSHRHRQKLIQRWPEEIDNRESPSPSFPAAISRAAWRARGCPRRILVVDDRLPLEGVGSGFGRMRDMVLELAQAGWAVSVLPRHGPATPPPDDLVAAGIRCVDQPVQEHLARHENWYDVVLVSRPQNFAEVRPHVRRLQPWAKLVFDCEALFWRRMERQAQLLGDSAEADELRTAAMAMRHVEESNVSGADLTIAISEDEGDQLRLGGGGQPVSVIPPIDRGIVMGAGTFRTRRQIGFVAGWLAGPTAPNADGLRWFVERVLPLVRAQVPWVKVRVTGANPPQDLLALAGPNVVFEGYVSDLGAFYASIRAAVVPIRFGAGVKIKTVQGMQHGVPTVATTIGAEGILPDPSAAIIISDDPEGFAKGVIQLLTDEDEWDRRRAALEHLTQGWSSRGPVASLSSVMQSLCNG